MNKINVLITWAVARGTYEIIDVCDADERALKKVFVRIAAVQTV